MLLINIVKDIKRKNEYQINDDYVIRDGKKHPIAIICPGGGYTMVVSCQEGIPYAEYLNKKGISAVILHYRVKGKAIGFAPQDDLARAIETIVKKSESYNVDMEHYSIWGSSAGGHLAASFGTKNMGYAKFNLQKPSCLVLCYPVVSMHKELTHADSRRYLIGRNASVEEEIFASVDEQVDADYPKTFVWCGDADTTVPPENSKRLDAALSREQVEHKFIIYPGVKHGVGLAKRTVAAGWIDDAINFWLK